MSHTAMSLVIQSLERARTIVEGGNIIVHGSDLDELRSALRLASETHEILAKAVSTHPAALLPTEFAALSNVAATRRLIGRYGPLQASELVKMMLERGWRQRRTGTPVGTLVHALLAARWSVRRLEDKRFALTAPGALMERARLYIEASATHVPAKVDKLLMDWVTLPGQCMFCGRGWQNWRRSDWRRYDSGPNLYDRGYARGRRPQKRGD